LPKHLTGTAFVVISPVTDLSSGKLVCDPAMNSIAGVADVRWQAGFRLGNHR
jgi:hypothetical protein